MFPGVASRQKVLVANFDPTNYLLRVASFNALRETDEARAGVDINTPLLWTVGRRDRTTHRTKRDIPLQIYLFRPQFL